MDSSVGLRAAITSLGQTVLPVTTEHPIDDNYSNAPMCYQCGVSMVRAGSCHCCPQCGATSGCS